jgi:hypothetical protein
MAPKCGAISGITAMNTSTTMMVRAMISARWAGPMRRHQMLVTRVLKTTREIAFIVFRKRSRSAVRRRRGHQGHPPGHPDVLVGVVLMLVWWTVAGTRFFFGGRSGSSNEGIMQFRRALQQGDSTPHTSPYLFPVARSFCENGGSRSLPGGMPRFQDSWKMLKTKIKLGFLRIFSLLDRIVIGCQAAEAEAEAEAGFA